MEVLRKDKRDTGTSEEQLVSRYSGHSGCQEVERKCKCKILGACMGGLNTGIGVENVSSTDFLKSEV